MAGASRVSAACAFRMRLAVALLATLIAAGCAFDDNLRRVSEPVSSVEVGDPGDVSAISLSRAMIRVGFSRDEILDLGPGIRRSLAQSGGAQARRQGQIVALFSHKDGKLYVTSGRTGTFVLDAFSTVAHTAEARVLVK